MKFYIEAGANDGLFQSRSLNFIHNYEYTGILIEPLPWLYKQCCINRPKNTLIYNCALVDFEYENNSIELHLHHMHSSMSAINKSIHETYNNSIQVPARTLESILEENNITHIDYLFLDVEGYEYNVINGINFNKRTFNNIEIECHYSLMNKSMDEEIKQHTEFLSNHYYNFTHIDYSDGHPKLKFTYEKN